MSIDKVFFIFEIIGTVAFAITGVITAIEKKLDIFGAVVLGTVTAVGGGMVRDILDTSKVQDLQEEEKQKLYEGGEIGAVLQEYAMQIADKKLEVTDSIPEDCLLFMSRNTFQKVWSNLIGNAVQYTEQGGQITIAADKDKIWIENSCTPLTEEQLAYIYEPFYRVDDTRAASGGNGLGLYVVRELLKKEGFRYVFEPVEDGMRFTIFL